MSTIGEFKFACPVCGQHLQAKPEEAGQRTECPSCFKGLIVPQAPTEGGGKLIISAALADTRRVPSRSAPPPPSTAAGASVPPPPTDRSVSLRMLGVVAVIVVVGVVLGFFGRMDSDRRDQGDHGFWTSDESGLRLLDAPVQGRLRGWDFDPGTLIWRETGLILKQEAGLPTDLRLRLIFPLKGGELVSGKEFRVGATAPALEHPIDIYWTDQRGEKQRESVSSDYLLLIRFDRVSASTIEGRLHLCLLDEDKSWVAGRFSAENRTKKR